MHTFYLVVQEFSNSWSLEAPLLTIVSLPKFRTPNKIQALQAQDSAKLLKSQSNNK